MLQEENQIIELDEFLNALDETSLQLLKNAKRICFLFGLDNQYQSTYFENQFCLIFNIFKNSQIEIKKVVQNQNECHFCFLPRINNRQGLDGKFCIQKKDYKTLVSEKISLVKKGILFEKLTSIKVHYIIQIENLIEVEGKKEMQKCTYFKKMQNFQFCLFKCSAKKKKMFQNEDFLNQIWLLNYQNFENEEIRSISLKVQNYCQRIISSCPFNKQLDEFYQKLKHYYYIFTIIDDENFKIHLISILSALRQELFPITQTNFIEQLLNLKQITEKNTEIFTKLQIMIQNSNETVHLYLKKKKIKTEELKLNFTFDKEFVLDIQNQIFQSKIQLQWDVIPLLNIFQIINYLLQQAPICEKNKSGKILRLFQTPQQIEDDRQGIFILGKTSVGKSTLAQLLIYPNLIKVEKLEYQIDQDDLDREFNLNDQAQNNSVFKVNHEMISSENRQIVSEKLNEKYMIFDCPGLDDNQKIYQQINVYNIYQQLKYCKKFILLILIDGESQHNFYQNFKDTVQYLNAFGDRFLCQTNFKPIFVITKIKYKNTTVQASYLYKIFKDKENFLRRDDNVDFIEEFKVFFSAFETGRVIYFSNTNLNFQLKHIQKSFCQILYNLNYEQQNHIQIECKPIKYICENEDLKKLIKLELDLLLNFYISNQIYQTLKEPIEEIKTDTKSILQIIQKYQNSNYFELFNQVEKWKQSKSFLQNNNLMDEFLQSQLSCFNFMQNIFYNVFKQVEITSAQANLNHILSLCNQSPDLFIQTTNYLSPTTIDSYLNQEQFKCFLN